MTLKKQAVNSVQWYSIKSINAIVIQLIQVAVLAYFLDPRDFGLMAIAQFIIHFTSFFVDIGFSKAIIQRKEISKEQLDSLYWMNIIMGVFWAAVIYFSSGFIASFYSEPELINILIYVSLILFLYSFGVQFEALLQKELKFKALTLIEIPARVVQLISSVVLAALGFGVYALVWGQLVFIITKVILLIFKGSRIHKPSFSFRLSRVKSFLEFGLYQSGQRVIAYFVQEMDTLLIGKLLGMQWLGLYSIAKTITRKPGQFINPIINRVAFPIMSKVQDQTDKLRTVYLKSLNLVTAVNFPIYVLMSVLAEPIVLLLFGEKWSGSIPYVQLLPFFLLIRIKNVVAGPAILSRGFASISFYWNLIQLITYPFFIYFGSFYDLKGIVIAMIFFQILLTFPHWLFVVNKAVDVSFIVYFKSILNPFFMSFFAGLLTYVTIYLIESNILQLVVGCIIFSSIYLLTVLKFNKKIIYDLLEFLSGIKSLKKYKEKIIKLVDKV